MVAASPTAASSAYSSPPTPDAPVRRVGELDEEMVFESRVGDIFLLGASSWRIEEITHDRVLVTPAPGEPGKMPFWRGDGPGRPLEFGRAIGELVREIAGATTTDAEAKLVADHHLDPAAAAQLVRYIHDEKTAATAEVPTDRTIVVATIPRRDRRLARSASYRRTAPPCTPPGPWPCAPNCSNKAARSSTSSGPTTASYFACPRPTPPRTSPNSSPAPTSSRTSSSPASPRPRCSPPASARTPAAPCS
jgi:hypothetical protein